MQGCCREQLRDIPQKSGINGCSNKGSKENRILPLNKKKKLRKKSGELINEQAAHYGDILWRYNWVGKNALLFKMVSLFVINDYVLVFYFHYSLPVEGINFTQLKTFSKGTK